jgi:hypothetical protein
MRRAVLCLAAAALALPLSAGRALGASTIPVKISFQALLSDKDTGNPITGAVDIRFNLYEAVDALEVDAVFSETHSAVTPGSEGIVTLMIGSIGDLTTVDFSIPLWLGVKVGTDDEMTPRFALATVPYAMHAAVSDGLGTVTEGDFVDLESDVAANTTALSGLDDLYVNEAGDTMTGPLALPADGLVTGTN